MTLQQKYMLSTDIGSLSRVGRSDVVADAGRILKYMTALKKGA